MATWIKVLIVIIILLLIASVVLYFVGRKMQDKQIESQKQMEAIAQPATILVIDKKKMKMKDAGLPKMVMEQTPKRYQRFKMPIVKAKIGNRIMTLIADEKVFEVLPVKTECKVIISGLYITEIKSVRGGSIPQAPAKKGVRAKITSFLRKNADKANAAARQEADKQNGKNGSAKKSKKK